MAKQGASTTRLAFDGLALSAHASQFTLNINQETPNARDFESLGPDRVTDGYDWNASFTGYFDGASGSVDENVFYDTSSTHHLSAALAGYTAGNVAYFGTVTIGNDAIVAQTGNATGLSATFNGSSGLTRGVVLDTGAKTGISNSTGQNLGATSAGDEFVVHLHVVVDDFSDLDIEIQESSDDGSGDAYAAISGFTQANISAVGSYRFTTTSATEAWKRVAVTGFTGTTGTIHVFAGTQSN